MQYKDLKNGSKRFEEFKLEYMDLTGKYTIETIENFCDKVDVYVAGSDQIWNCLNEIIKPFYLDFVKKGKKIAYAASIGISEIPKSKKEEFGNLVSNFDAISVREQDAQRLLKKDYNLDSEVVCDPVLLLESSHWVELAGKKIVEEKYILCYCLGDIEDVNECLKNLKKIYHLPVYLISRSGYTRVYHDKLLCDVGPLEFISLIKNAEIIVCSSFHGTVFSTIFEKKFIAVADKLKPARVKDYLNYLELTHCLYNENIDYEIEIDYIPVREKLKKYRERSLEFIEKNIES